jgi:hypothetical protein
MEHLTHHNMTMLTSLSFLLIILLANNAVGFSSFTPCYGVGVRRRKSLIVTKAADNDKNPSEDLSTLDMDILRQRMDHQQNQYAELIMEQSRYNEQEKNLPESVHIILFHPDTPNQNVHTLEIPKGSGNNMILAFEDGGDCGMFARMLRELEFVDPSVSVFNRIYEQSFPSYNTTDTSYAK